MLATAGCPAARRARNVPIRPEPTMPSPILFAGMCRPARHLTSTGIGAGAPSGIATRPAMTTAETMT